MKSQQVFVDKMVKIILLKDSNIVKDRAVEVDLLVDNAKAWLQSSYSQSGRMTKGMGLALLIVISSSVFLVDTNP